MDNPLLQIRPATPDCLEKLTQAAQEDNHAVLWPTDVLSKNGQVVGYVSIANMPAVHMWLHTQKVNVRDSMTVFSYINGLLARQGVKHYWLPCQTKSPLFPFVERVGFHSTDYDHLFIGDLVNGNIK